MNPTFEFCDARAREAADMARAAQLDNVRDQALRSEAAWRIMADKQRAVLDARNARIQEQTDEASSDGDVDFGQVSVGSGDE